MQVSHADLCPILPAIETRFMGKPNFAGAMRTDVALRCIIDLDECLELQTKSEQRLRALDAIRILQRLLELRRLGPEGIVPNWVFVDDINPRHTQTSFGRENRSKQ